MRASLMGICFDNLAHYRRIRLPLRGNPVRAATTLAFPVILVSTRTFYPGSRSWIFNLAAKDWKTGLRALIRSNDAY